MAHSLKVLDKANSYIMLQKSYLLFVAFVHVQCGEAPKNVRWGAS